MFKYIKEVADIRKLKKYTPTKFKSADKEKSTEKIDGSVATIMALDRAIRNSSKFGGSVYDERGILIL